ncbi:MAG: SRPBCC family protein [Thermoanaerobaculia bacterium]
MSERKVEKQIAIKADAAAVWKALTDAEELKRWFPLDAKVTPGLGGSIMVTWSEGGEGDWVSEIAIWEPNRHLRTVDPPREGSPVRMAIDYSIESSRSETVLRLVHSGWASDAWDDEIDSTDSGWAAFLGNLKHYLEHHRGEPRALAFYRHPPIAIDRHEAFIRTLHALGFVANQPLQSGDRYDITAESGDRFQGEIRLVKPPMVLIATTENWSNGWLMVEIEPGRGRCRPAVWLSLYGEARRDAAALTERFRNLLESAFANPG